jgi:single-stranded DNA-binding protein
MQKTLLIGYLGKDPEIKYTPGGTAIATYLLYTVRVYTVRP